MNLTFDSQEMVYLIYCGIALGVLLAFTGIAQMSSRNENRSEAKSRRMRMISQGRSTAELLALLKPQQNRGILSRLPFIGDLPRKLVQAGVLIRPAVFVQICILFAIIIFIATNQYYGPLVGALAGFTLGIVTPMAFVQARCNSQTQKLIHQLPDALDMMARGLKVGHPLNTSIGYVAEEMADPIATEFGIVFDQVNYGEDLPDAFQEFAERVDLEDVNYLSASIGIQHGTGGDLANVIEVLSRVIRDRIAMRRKIRAISSEGRMSSWFLSALPFIIFAMTSVMSPDYYAGVADDPLFQPMAISIVFLTVMNVLVLKKLVEFRV